MSFSRRCKKEILKKDIDVNTLDSELASYLFFIGSLRLSAGSFQIIFSSGENLESRYIYNLVKAKYGLSPSFNIKERKKFSSDRDYKVIVEDQKAVEDLLRLKDEYEFDDSDAFASHFKRVEEKKVFLKTAFVLKGSINDPNRGYNLEMNTSDLIEALVIKSFCDFFDLDAKKKSREASYTVYLKDSEKISDFLAIVGANKSLFELEDTKAYRAIRNDTNRKTNFDRANIDRTVKASLRQVDAINFLKEKGAFEDFPQDTREIGNLRLENPYVSIEDLGKMADPPMSKSKVNYRLQKFISTYEKIREEENDK